MGIKFQTVTVHIHCSQRYNMPLAAIVELLNITMLMRLEPF